MSIVLFTVKGNKKNGVFEKMVRSVRNGVITRVAKCDYEGRKVSFFLSLQIITIVTLKLLCVDSNLFVQCKL